MQPCVAVVTVEWSLCMLMATITVCSLSSSPFTDNGRSVSHIVQHSNSQQDHAYRDRIAYRTTHHQSEGTLLSLTSLLSVLLIVQTRVTEAEVHGRLVLTGD